MAGYTRNDVADNIADGNVINASDLDGEFDAVQAAFNNSTGHTHDGTAGEGAPIENVGPTQDLIVTATEVKAKTDNTLDLGTSSVEFKDGYFDGTVYTDGLSVEGNVDVTGDLDVDNININGNTIISTDTNGNIAITPDGSGEVDISKVDIDAGTIDGVTIGTNSAVTEAQIDNLNINGNTIISSDTDGAINLTPNGTGSVVISKVDVAAGEIDGTAIGANSASTGNFTTLSLNGTDVTSTAAELNILDGATLDVNELNLIDGSSAGTIVNSKAVIYGASGEVNATTLQIGGNSITSTAAELNLLDGVTATTAELNYNDLTTLGTSEASKVITADANNDTVVSGSVRGTVTTDNDLSFDMDATNNFKCTPTGTGTLTFTNITAGQSGNIWLDNSGGHVISAAATTYISAADLSTISTAGVYFMSYYSDGTNVAVSVTQAITSAGA